MNGWGVGKYEDMCDEMHECGLDIIGLNETHLRDRIEMNSNPDRYKMIGKGRNIWKKQGGGVGVLIRNSLPVSIEEIEVNDCMECEDILVLKIQPVGHKDKECMLLIICYMTTSGESAMNDNVNKYESIRKIIGLHKEKKIILMGDMNGHIGLLGEPVNNNGRLLLDFSEELNLEILNLTMGERCPTWNARGQVSAVDYFLVNENARQNVERMWVDDGVG